MKHSLKLLPLLAALALSACTRSANAPAKHTVETGPLQVWTVYPGKLEARQVKVIMSKFNGSATIVELAPEGMPVHAGDLLVKFDSSQLERDLLKLQRDYQLAKSDLERTEKAELPLELRDLEAQRLEAQMNYEAEKQFLEDTRELMKEDLVSEQEVDQQKLKVEQLQSQVQKLDQKIELTRDFLHPAAMERARATLSSAEQELSLAKTQLESCTVTSPADGVVVYRPLHISGEFRTVRVGDSIFKNQPFMIIPDMRDLIIEVQIPEAELSRIEAGRDVRVTPLSYPDLKIPGTVESVGSMATIMADRPGWQRFFRAVIGLKQSDERLRSGMSVQAEILSYSTEQALLVPRNYVHMDGNQPFVRLAGSSAKKQFLKLGWADLSNFEVLDGLKPGDVVIP